MLAQGGFGNDFVLYEFSEDELFLQLADFKIKWNVKNGKLVGMATSKSQEAYEVSVFNMKGIQIGGIDFIEEDLQNFISKIPLCFMDAVEEFANSKDVFTNGTIEIEFKLVDSLDIYNNLVWNRFTFHKDENITRKKLLTKLKEKETPEPDEENNQREGEKQKDAQGSKTKTKSGVKENIEETTKPEIKTKDEETTKPKDKTSDSSNECTFKIDWWVWLIVTFVILLIGILAFLLIRNYLVKKKETDQNMSKKNDNDKNSKDSIVEII